VGVGVGVGLGVGDVLELPPPPPQAAMVAHKSRAVKIRDGLISIKLSCEKMQRDSV
jgi:hypothetical protein